MDRDEKMDEVVWILLNTKCPLCPNPIGISREFTMTTAPDLIEALRARGAQVMKGPQGEFVMIHVRCLENLKLTTTA